MVGPVTGILQIHVSVTDIERSVAFYRDVLGLRHLFTVPRQPMAFFDVEGVRLYLGVPEDEAFRSRPVVYYSVDDITAAFDEVVSRGAPVIAGPSCAHRDSDGELWLAFVADPDGTPVALSEQRYGS